MAEKLIFNTAFSDAKGNKRCSVISNEPRG